MLTKDFYFDLPEELIAQFPTERRGDERLLVLSRDTGCYTDRMMRDFPSLLSANSVLVVNNSKVRKARVFAESENGGTVEFLFLSENPDLSWNVMAKRAKKQKIGKRYLFSSGDKSLSFFATLTGENEDGTKVLTFDKAIDENFFLKLGHVPLPPYIKREDLFSDENRYQTIYAKKEGSVASPTAGLHFTPEILSEIKEKGIEIYEVTLHVGSGTFLPVRTENIENHHMHTESYEISESVASSLNRAKKEGKKIVAVGTTSMRTLESASDADGLLKAGINKTDIFIYPGYRFRFVDELLTNFHTPESTLLMLVSAFSRREYIMNAYEHAIKEKYRFFSYGDAMFIRKG